MGRWLMVMVGSLTIAGCANLTSIDRHTHLPGKGASEGIAIHLDAKQRLAFAKAFGAVCAEPSPDALSAFASAFGGGIAVPQQGSAAISHALSEASASIGLRTQSITLMRDALYRICEAYYNRALNQVMVMQLLGRAQDLTLAVLAIEQLTQPIVAQQAVLNTTASSSASAASLFANQQVLEAARKAETQASEQVTTAKAKVTATEKKVGDLNTELTSLKAQDPYTQTIEALQKELDAASTELTTAEGALKNSIAKRDAANKKVKFLKEEIDIVDPNSPRLPKLRADLVQAEKDATAAVQAVTAAETKRDAAKTKAEAKTTEIEKVKERDTDWPKIEALQKDIKQANEDLVRDKKALKDAEATAQTAKESRQALERNQTSAQAAASTTASGSFSAPIVIKPPASDAAIATVAANVTRIVETVVKRDHREGACLALLSSYASRSLQLRRELRQPKDAEEHKKIRVELQREEDEYAEAIAVCKILLPKPAQEAVEAVLEKAK